MHLLIPPAWSYTVDAQDVRVLSYMFVAIVRPGHEICVCTPSAISYFGTDFIALRVTFRKPVPFVLCIFHLPDCNPGVLKAIQTAHRGSLSSRG